MGILWEVRVAQVPVLLQELSSAAGPYVSWSTVLRLILWLPSLIVWDPTTGNGRRNLAYNRTGHEALGLLLRASTTFAFSYRHDFTFVATFCWKCFYLFFSNGNFPWKWLSFCFWQFFCGEEGYSPVNSAHRVTAPGHITAESWWSKVNFSNQGVQCWGSSSNRTVLCTELQLNQAWYSVRPKWQTGWGKCIPGITPFKFTEKKTRISL